MVSRHLKHLLLAARWEKVGQVLQALQAGVIQLEQQEAGRGGLLQRLPQVLDRGAGTEEVQWLHAGWPAGQKDRQWVTRLAPGGAACWHQVSWPAQPPRGPPRPLHISGSKAPVPKENRQATHFLGPQATTRGPWSSCRSPGLLAHPSFTSLGIDLQLRWWSPLPPETAAPGRARWLSPTRSERTDGIGRVSCSAVPLANMPAWQSLQSQKACRLPLPGAGLDSPACVSA